MIRMQNVHDLGDMPPLPQFDHEKSFSLNRKGHSKEWNVLSQTAVQQLIHSKKPTFCTRSLRIFANLDLLLI